MRACLILFLLLAGLARAQSPAVDAEKLLADAQKKLKELSDAKTDEEKRFKEAVEYRIKLLDEYRETRKQRAALVGSADLEQRSKAAKDALDRESKRSPPKAPALEREEDVAPFETAFKKAETARDAAQSELARVQSRLADARKEQLGLPKREAEAKRRESELKGGDEYTQYRHKTAGFELAVVRDRAAFLDQRVKRFRDLIPVLTLEHDLAKVRYERAAKVRELATEAVRMLRKKKADKLKAEAEEQKRKAEQAKDPLVRFLAGLKTERTQTKGEEQTLQNRLDELQRELQTTIDRTRMLQLERERIDKRLALRAKGVAEILRQTLSRVRQMERLVTQVERPRLEQGIVDNQRELVGVLDRLWALQTPLSDNQVLAGLLAKLPESRHKQARQSFQQAIRDPDGVITALRAKQRLLERIEARYGEQQVTHTELENEVESLLTFILSRIYWLRSDEPIGPTLFRQAWEEVRGLFSKHASATTWAGMVLLLAFGFFFSHRLCKFGAWLPTTVPEKPRAGHIVGAILLAAVIPAILVTSAGLMTLFSLPKALRALPELFWFVAAILFVRSLARRFLAPTGIAPRLGMREDVGCQILRVIHLVTMASLFAWAPAAILVDPPFSLEHLPRLLDTAWHICVIFGLVILIRHKGPLVQHWTNPDGFPRRFWRVSSPIFTGGLVLALFMDLAGYRVGAVQLARNMIRTIAAFVILAGVYRLLVRASDRIATKVRKRVVKEEGAAAAWDSATAVAQQLSRFAAMLITIVALFSLVRFWGIDRQTVSLLESLKITEVRTDEWLTGYDVGVALLWVMGAHVVTHYLGTIYELVVFPLIGSTDRGGRFVVVTLSRYAILVIAYGAALVTLKFSFTSIGWLLTAASVGLGFGLQEIVANFISGLILLFERPIRVGDLITVGQTGGTVERIQIRATSVTNWDRQTIIVPNKVFITQNLTNWTRNDDVMRRKIQVQVAYGSDIETVLRTLDELVGAHDKVLADPPYRIWFDSFGESGVNIEIWFFTMISDGFQTLTDLHKAIYERFQQDEISIPFPQRDIRIQPSDADLLGGLLEPRETKES